MIRADRGSERRVSGGIAIFLTVVLLALVGLAAEAQVGQDPGASGNLFPVGVSDSTLGQPSSSRVYTLWDLEDREAPGRFTWLYWVDGGGVTRGYPPQNAQVSILGENILDTRRSGFWRVGDWMRGNPGVNFQPILDELGCRMNSTNCPPGVTLIPTVTIPIYDQMRWDGDYLTARIVRFGTFRLVCARSSATHYVERQPGDCGPCDKMPGDVKCLRGYLVGWAQPGATEMDSAGIAAPARRGNRP
ncbi:MAG: hypothetical protein JXM73_13385 [Anaerolineae bacterium]|nr:hypothetical protein [Anaerolineae bacterium]